MDERGVPPLGSSIEIFTLEILVYKVWVVVEFKATVTRQRLTLPPPMTSCGAPCPTGSRRWSEAA